MAHSTAANNGAYNNLADTDMSTVIGNGRASVDLTSRIAVGGDTMPSARVLPDYLRNEQLRPQSQTQQPSPPNPQQPNQPQAPQSDAKTVWMAKRLQAVPNGAGWHFADHPQVRQLLERQFTEPNPVDDGGEMLERKHAAELGGLIGQLVHQRHHQQQQQQAARLASTAAAAGSANPAADASKPSMPAWVIPTIVAVFVALIVGYAWYGGWLSFKPAVAASVASSGSSSGSSGSTTSDGVHGGGYVRSAGVRGSY